MVTPDQIKWKILPEASAAQAALVGTGVDKWIAVQVPALREFMCGYFSAHLGCVAALHKSISPTGPYEPNGKLLKVRWKLPGGGKRGGVRITMAVFCEELRVVVLTIDQRKELG